jgi:hypothetical protein
MQMSQASLKLLSLALVVLFTVSVNQPVWAQSTLPEDDSTTAEQAGLGAASFLLTIPYGVSKVVFAAAGGIVGGLAYVFSGADTKTAQNIWTTSVYGTYVITPDHLRGDKPVRFLGVPEDATDPYLEKTRY